MISLACSKDMGFPTTRLSVISIAFIDNCVTVNNNLGMASGGKIRGDDDSVDKPLFVTGWFKRHGFGYLDVVLAALERSNLSKQLDAESPPRDGKVALKEADQYRLSSSLGYFSGESTRAISSWSAVHYLIPKGELEVDHGRAEELIAEGKWQRVIGSVRASKPDWSDWADSYKELRKEIEASKSFPSLDWFERCWKTGGVVAMRSLWHVINEAPINTQIEWYKRYSPLYAANRKLVRFIEVSADDIDDPAAVTRSMNEWLEDLAAGHRCVVNLWGTATAVQFGWHYLSWCRPALRHAAFLKCRTPKPKTTKRFVPVDISFVPADPISELEAPRKPRDWESRVRRDESEWLSFCLARGDNFSILLLGDRGTGKSRAVSEAWNSLHKTASRPMVPANCLHRRPEVTPLTPV